MPGNDNLGIERGTKTPVESHETRRAGVTNDVQVPILLAIAVAFGVAGAWDLCLLLVRAIAAHIYWLWAALATGLLFFAPIIRRLVSRVRGQPLSHRQYDAVTNATLVCGFLLTLTGAAFSYSLWRVTRDLKVWQLLITGPVVGWLAGLLWLVVSTSQEAMFRSPFIEQALASLVNQQETPWYRQQQNQPKPVPLPPRDVRIEWTEHSNGRTMMRNYDDWPLNADQTEWLARHIVNGGSLSVPQCSGRGKPLSRDDVEKVREWGFGKGFWEWVDENVHDQGVRVRAKGNALFAGLAGDGNGKA